MTIFYVQCQKENLLYWFAVIIQKLSIKFNTIQLFKSSIKLELHKTVLGPLLFNLYVNDLQDIDPADLVNTCQYADDTTQYEHFKISQIRQTIQNTQKRLDNLKVGSRNNLMLNGTKTKNIIFFYY